MNTTTAEYHAFDEAYDYFNARLFDGTLPMCLITLQRKAKAYGYHSPERFISRVDEGKKIDEIALNPDTFGDCTDKDILDTLVHEMAHLWQFKFGKPSRGGYHNKEWADKMEAIGLMPSSTGQPGGKRVGQRMSDYIIKGGPFDQACDALLVGDFRLNWQSVAYAKRGRVGQQQAEAKKKSKTKYSCASCGQNAWAKPESKLVCGECMEMMQEAE